MEKKRIMVLPYCEGGTIVSDELKALEPLADRYEVCWSDRFPSAGLLVSYDALVINVDAHPFFPVQGDTSHLCVLDRCPSLREGIIPIILTTKELSTVNNEKAFRTIDIVHDCIFVRQTGRHNGAPVIPGQETLRAAVEKAAAERPARTLSSAPKAANCLPGTKL